MKSLLTILLLLVATSVADAGIFCRGNCHSRFFQRSRVQTVRKSRVVHVTKTPEGKQVDKTVTVEVNPYE